MSEPGVFGSGAAWKKSQGAGAGATKKLDGFSALLEDKKHKEIVLSFVTLL